MNISEEYHKLNRINKVRIPIMLVVFILLVRGLPALLSEGIIYTLGCILPAVFIVIVSGYLIASPYQIWVAYRYPSSGLYKAGSFILCCMLSPILSLIIASIAYDKRDKTILVNTKCASRIEDLEAALKTSEEERSRLQGHLDYKAVNKRG